MFSWLRAGLSRLSIGGTQGVALVANWLAGILWTFEATFLNLTRQGYRGNEVVYACLRLLSTSTPEPPLMAYTEDDKGEREALKKTHPLVSLIRHPNELMTEYEFWELATLHLAIVGRSTWWKERNRRGVPIALWPLRPDRIGPVYSDSSKAGEKVLRGWAYQIPGQGSVIELHRRDVLSFNFPDPAGESGGIVEGLGPLAALAKQVASDNEATNFVGALLANYAAPTVVLKVKQAIRSEAEAKLKKAAFRAEFGGARRGTPAIIDGDATIETVGFNLRELEFPEIREIAETRIAATLGVPAGLVGLRAGLKLGADRSNFAESREFFAETTLANYWRRFQDQYMLDVAAEFGEDIVCEFDTTKVKALAAQFVAQVQPIKDAFKDGAATVNEYREALKLDPIPDGDVRFVPSSVQQVPVGGVKEEPPKQLPPGESAPALLEGGEAASEEEPLEGEEAKSTKHLAGQHDQDTHGSGGGGGDEDAVSSESTVDKSPWELDKAEFSYKWRQSAQTEWGIPLAKMDKTDAKNWLGYTGQATLTVYRGGSVDRPVENGDFVTTSPETAQQYGPYVREVSIPASRLRYVRGSVNGNPKDLDVGGQPELIYASHRGTLHKQVHSYEHRKLVEQALLSGKQVPAKVLVDYPDLVAESTKSASKAVAPRDRHERELQAALLAVFEKFAPDVAAQIARGEMPDTAALEAALRDAIEVKLIEVFDDDVYRLGEAVTIQFDPAVVNAEAVRWAKQYTFDLVKGLTDKTRGTLQEVIAKYNDTPGMTIGDVRKLLEADFGARRAEVISITEITRGAQAAMNFYQQELEGFGISMVRRWRTAKDELVCFQCGPLADKLETEWPGDVDRRGPPRHPRCRCTTTLELAGGEAKSVTLPDDDAAKFNPFHGADGRFSGGTGATSFNPGPGQAMQRVTYDIGSRQSNAPAPKTPKTERTAAQVRGDMEGFEQSERAALDALYVKRESLMEQYAGLMERRESATGKDYDAIEDDMERNIREQDALYETMHTRALAIDGHIREQFIYAKSKDIARATKTQINDSFSDSVKQQIETELADFDRMFSRRDLDLESLRTVFVNRLQPGSRAYQLGNSIFIADDRVLSREGVVMHEAGHWFEGRDASINRAANNFLESRTRGEPTERLSKITGNRTYERTEVAKKDRFTDPYAGRIYAKPAIGDRPTEIISMGMQQMYKNPRRFASEDPEYFDFIYDVLRGRQ